MKSENVIRRAAASAAAVAAHIPITVNRKEWPAVTGLAAQTMDEVAALGLIPCARVGRRKLMLRKDVERFLREQIEGGKPLPIRAMHKELMQRRAEGLLPEKAKRGIGSTQRKARGA